MAAAKPLVPIIVGPTAIGKTALAVALSHYWPITVVSADSRQVYRRLDIGTGKPVAHELASVPHLGLDVVEPGESYSAGRFAREAAGWIADLPEERQPVVVGGTGFYIRALADGLFHEPPMDPQARRRLRRWASRAPGLAGWATRLDPAYSGGGRQRASRTVEVALLTGRSLSWWQAHARQQGVLRPWFVRLTVPRPVLYQKIAERVERMLAAGWVDEVQSLLDAGVPSDAAGLDGLGYREIVRFLHGRLEADDLEPAIVRSTRRYAKRQETWFRHQLAPHPVVTVDATGEPATLAARIVERWRAREESCESE